VFNVLKQQYNLIRSTRNTLFNFLDGVPLKNLHTTVSGFGSGSIIKTHIHVADCYRYWLANNTREFERVRGLRVEDWTK